MIARNPGTLAQNLILSSRLGLVSIPPEPAREAASAPAALFEREEAIDALRRLGNDLGMSCLEPKAESFPEAESGDAAGVEFADEAIRKAYEALDVVWIRGGEMVAAFVVENASGPWSGVRRLADALALNPKSKCAYYVLSVPELKLGLLKEMHRPVYRLLKKPLPEIARILDWTRLQEELAQLGERVRYLKPEFLEGISEASELPVAVT